MTCDFSQILIPSLKYLGKDVEYLRLVTWNLRRAQQEGRKIIKLHKNSTRYKIACTCDLYYKLRGNLIYTKKLKLRP